MPYIGHNPTNAGSFALIDDIASTFNGSNTTFTLQVGNVNITPNAQNTVITLDGVIQHTPESYTISGSTITFTGAPASGTDFYGILMGNSSYVENNSIGADELTVNGDGTSLQVLASDGDGTFSWVSQSALTPSANLVTGATLKSTVTASSLTSVGTLTGLSVDGGTSSLNRGNSSGDILDVRGQNTSQMKVTTTAFTVTPASTFSGNVVVTGADTRQVQIQDTSSDGQAKLQFTNDATSTTMGLFGNDSDKFKIYHDSTWALTFGSGGDATFAGNITMPAGNAIYLDGGGDSKIEEFATNKINIQAGGDSLVIDGSGSTALVGIGTTSPGYQLDLRRNDTGTTTSLGIRQLGSGDASMAFQTTTSPYGFCVGVDGSDSDAFKIATGLTDVGTNTRLKIEAGDGTVSIPGSLSVTGVVTINTRIKVDASASAYIYHDSGSTSHPSWFVHQMGGASKWYIGNEGSQTNYQIYDISDGSVATQMNAGGNTWTANSDGRLKKDVTSMGSRLDDLLKIKVREFKWKRNDREDVGFIAQELESLVPEAVVVGSDEVYSKEESEDSETMIEGALKNPYQVSREMLIPMMIKSIQELSAKVEALENG